MKKLIFIWTWLGAISHIHAQSVRVTTVRLMNDTATQINLNQPLRLDYKQNYLSINFEDSSDINPDYQYRLSNVDWYWVKSGQRNQAVYSNLFSGDYTFWVKNTHTNQVSSTFRFTIEPAFWQRWWFIPLLFGQGILLIGVVLYLLYLYRIRQFLRLQRVRDRIARDLHDDMGSYLSSISILSQNAYRSVTKDPAKTQATLNRIGQTARQVMESMGDIVWSINPDHDSMTQVIVRMTDVASRLFTDDTEPGGRVALEMHVSDDVRQLNLSAECRRDFFLTYKEAITNVARYAQASRVRVRLQRAGGWLEMTVQDNGCGFDQQNPAQLNPAGGNGLQNMKTRAAFLSGELRIESVIGQGTTVLLRIPL